jgi:hypothetical protein
MIMRRLFGAAVLAAVLAPALGAQQPADSMPSMLDRMQAMESMMQQMHQMMQGMHGSGQGMGMEMGQAAPGQQGMGMGGGMGMGMRMGQQGMGTMAAATCSMGDGLAALFGACPSNLALTEAQTTTLQAIFERARGEAMGLLTPEQHTQLHATQGQVGGTTQGGTAPH